MADAGEDAPEAGGVAAAVGGVAAAADVPPRLVM